ncbi:LysM peptidoglycan-binding domain-containing protein [Streptococcus entericus]|uniref:LysM peptidoglycan-binding domain-containing protein n=1 Tax=Streptococcus entericus TaxID=155680 RepID=UPI00036F50F3|nr:LysM domain-containing protein [Streptococcus entericus]
MRKKMILGSSVALTLLTSGIVQAQDVVWTPRTADDVAADLSQQGHQASYTIKYGDTLSTIAKVLGVDVELLGNINQISNLDLIFPGTVLTTTVNENQAVTALEIQAPARQEAEPAQASINLETNQAVINNQVVDLAEVTTSETPAEQPAVEVTAPVAEAPTEVIPEVAETEAEVIEETVPATPVAEATLTEEVTPEIPVAVEVVEAQPETTAVETPDSAVTAPAPVGAAPSTEPVASVAPAPAVSEPVVATTPVEAAPEVVEKVVETPATTVAPAVTATAQATTFTGSEAGLQPHVVAYKQEVLSAFGSMWVHGYRPDSGDHGKGLALDFMVTDNAALGDQIAAYAASHMAEKKISYIIWKQRFYAPYESKYGPAYTWNLMEDRGSVTENHYDHVHISFLP